MTIRWEDPPERQRRAGKWEPAFQALREHPNKWAQLSVGTSRNSHSLAGRLRTQYNADKEFEIISRTIPGAIGVDGSYAGVYARYIGG